ncbi:hypothetical protein DAPPUDRAFT_277575 [Daphnia pulex]|uniref:Uncharacterized protein n=1 Tax=Daphnia pulex TaxID=6669 RepID=E9I6G0_DAPPU|nr:hypothetical protein DAPPUDRAFT_277575 [Daphnia pulex]|eukprot:EFX60420.1 hypothetical protein DAPPUDRAFT_277575 [Daphnia pulex]
MISKQTIVITALALASVHGQADVNSTDSRLLQTTSADFCWKNSYGRGIGQVPQSCGVDQERLGLLCYPKCPAGYSRKGLDCHSNCPSGFRDDGLFCRMEEYGRGGGYPWKFGDALNDSGMYNRCEGDNGRGNCEKWGAVVYPKCKPGYSPFGCCICRPNPPNCGALGLGGQIDLSCAKKIIVGAPELGTCAASEDRDAGLCYKKCTDKYTGVGPVCWAQPPKGWVECGMGAASSSLKCAEAVKDQVVSVGSLVVNIVTLGAGSSTKALQAPAEASKLAQLKNSWDAIKAKPLVQGAIKAYDAANKGKTGYKAMGDLEKAQTTEDYIRLAATISSILDPSGVSGVIAAYTYSTCDKVKA